MNHVRTDSPVRAFGYMTGASASFAAMNAFVAVLGRAGVPWQATAFARALLGVLFALAMARWRGASLHVHRQGVMWLRSIAGCLGMLGTFYALEHMPLADAAALLNTTPLWTAVIAWLVLRERAGRSVLVAIAIAAVGIALIERPSLRVGNFVGIAAIFTGLASAIAMVSLRRLSGETPEAVVVHFSGVATLATTVLLAAHLTRAGFGTSHVGATTAEVLAMGLAATSGQLFLTRAYGADRAARVGATGWLQVLFTTALDVVVLHRHLPLATVTGIALIASAGALLFHDAARSEANAEAARIAGAR